MKLEVHYTTVVNKCAYVQLNIGLHDWVKKKKFHWVVLLNNFEVANSFYWCMSLCPTTIQDVEQYLLVNGTKKYRLRQNNHFYNQVSFNILYIILKKLLNMRMYYSILLRYPVLSYVFWVKYICELFPLAAWK